MKRVKIIGIIWIITQFLTDGYKMESLSNVITVDVMDISFSIPIIIPATIDFTKASFVAKSGTSILRGITVNTAACGGASILGTTLKLSTSCNIESRL